LGSLVWVATQALVLNWRASAAWFVLFNLAELVILALVLRYRRTQPTEDAAVRWACLHTAAAGLVGLAWGLSAWFFWSPGQLAGYFANLLVLVAVSSISLIIMSPLRSATVLFSCGLLLPPVLHELVTPHPYAPYVVGGLSLLFVVQMFYARTVERELTRAIDGAVRNALLVRQLTAARADLQHANTEMAAKNDALQSALSRLNELATRDELTDIFNRRYIFEQLELQVSMKERHRTTACLVMFDLDHFKSINDRFGHPVGDKALKEVASVVAMQLRDGDILARVGGEEFLVLLPLTSLEPAGLLTERLRAALSRTSLPDTPDDFYLPASFGVAELAAGEDVASWFRRVDAALYQAKAQGRNALVMAH
jgi:diguanylate cyclase (GGDEF)-like protein